MIDSFMLKFGEVNGLHDGFNQIRQINDLGNAIKIVKFLN